MSRNLHLGAASISFSQPLYIESAASIVSQKEADGPLGDFFDLICKDPMFGCGTWESAESTLQKETATLAMNKAGLDFEYPPHVCRRSSCPDSGHMLRFRRTWNPLLRTLRRLLHHGRILVSRLPCSHRRFRHPGLMCHLQPFCKCGKRISFSSGIR